MTNLAEIRIVDSIPALLALLRRLVVVVGLAVSQGDRQDRCLRRRYRPRSFLAASLAAVLVRVHLVCYSLLSPVVFACSY